MKPNAVLSLLWLFLTTCLVTGCTSTVQVDSTPGFGFRAGDTYTWVDDGARTQATEALGDDVPWDELHAAFDAALRERGLQRVDGEEADIQAEMLLGFELLIRRNDPYFSFYVADRYEQASLILALSDGRGGRWSARNEQKLRLIERSVDSVAGAKWVDADQARDWDVDAFVSGIVAALPTALSADE